MSSTLGARQTNYRPGKPINYPGSTAYQEMQSPINKTALAHHLLRQCLDACKVNHLLRATNAFAVLSDVRRCDGAILGAFEDIVGVGLTPAQRAQAGLPLNVGGCGLRLPSVIVPAARVAALARYYSSSARAVGLPDVVCVPGPSTLTPVLESLLARFGPSSVLEGRRASFFVPPYSFLCLACGAASCVLTTRRSTA